MVSMEYLGFILILVMFVILLEMRSTVNRHIKDVNQRLDKLNLLIAKLKERPLSQATVQQSDKAKEIVPEKITDSKPESAIKNSAPEEQQVKIPPPSVKNEPELIRIAEQARAQKQIISPEPKKPGFFERNPDLEKFIGENLANKIGIAILVLGIAFFVKYAIDQEWIGIYGRVLIGVLCGGILIGLAHSLRAKFTAFSSVLVGGGIAVLYFTIYIAFHTYHIMSAEVAFGIMVIITAFTVLLSLAYNRMELAILAILGGFGSPFMVSTGEGNYIVLFSYVLILDIGMLVLAYFKKWRAVNIIAYIFTILLFGSWISTRFDASNVPMIRNGLLFATLFFVTFFVMNIINNVRRQISFEAPEFLLLLSNAFLFYSAGIVLLNNDTGEMYKGLFTALLGAFNFFFAFSLYKKGNIDKNLVFLLIGLVLTFVSLAGPVQLEGNYITLFWAAESVLLLWLSQKSGIILIKIASIAVLILTWISLTMDWYNVYSRDVAAGVSLLIVLNKGYITSLVSVGAAIMYYKLLKNESNDYFYYVRRGQALITLAVVLILYISNLLELTYHLNATIGDASTRTVLIGLYNAVFVLALIIAIPRARVADNIKQYYYGIGVVPLAGYFAVYQPAIIIARNHYISGDAPILGFVAHYPFIIILLIITVFMWKHIRGWKQFNEMTKNAYLWIFVFVFVYVASAELDHAVTMLSNTNVESLHSTLRQNHKIGFPILWGITSFILIAVGLQRKEKNLRIISMTLFLITLLKLFIVDIRGISEGGKIAAFISLGVLLLVVSFMYQRLKRLIMSDEGKDQPAENI